MEAYKQTHVKQVGTLSFFHSFFLSILFSSCRHFYFLFVSFFDTFSQLCFCSFFSFIHFLFFPFLPFLFSLCLFSTFSSISSVLFLPFISHSYLPSSLPAILTCSFVFVFFPFVPTLPILLIHSFHYNTHFHFTFVCPTPSLFPILFSIFFSLFSFFHSYSFSFSYPCFPLSFSSFVIFPFLFTSHFT